MKRPWPAYQERDYQWAAELASYLVRVDNDDMAARTVKAAAFRQLGYASMNINWRNWYLTSALELEGRLDTLETAKKMANIFMPPDILAEMPVEVSIDAWTTRLKAEQTLTVKQVAGVCIHRFGRILRVDDTARRLPVRYRPGKQDGHGSVHDQTCLQRGIIG